RIEDNFWWLLTLFPYGLRCLHQHINLVCVGNSVSGIEDQKVYIRIREELNVFQVYQIVIATIVFVDRLAPEVILSRPPRTTAPSGMVKIFEHGWCFHLQLGQIPNPFGRR